MVRFLRTLKKRNMKGFIVFLGLISVVGCKSSKDLVVSDAPTDDGIKSDEEKVVLVQGKVRSFDGCGFVIEIVEDYQVYNLYPVNLPIEFQQKNIKIEFSYRESRAMMPQGCNVNKVVTVENVKQLTQ